MGKAAVNRNIALDLLKLLMAAMVVAIHAEVFKDINQALSYFTVYGVFRIAVPVFLLINGFYFFQTLRDNRVTIWFKRLIALYLFWMLIYAPICFTQQNSQPKNLLNYFCRSC